MLTGAPDGDTGHVFAGDELLRRWCAAVELGALGRGASSLTALSELTVDARRAGDGPLAALATTTAASLYRQSGRHRDARALDSRALAVVDAAGAPSPHGVPMWNRAALADTLVNLAADNLGLLRFGVSHRLLERADVVLGRPDDLGEGPWLSEARCRLRLLWVRAEWALYTDNAEHALEVAERAQAQLAARADRGTERHRIKTGLVLAAARAGAGATEQARLEAAALRDQAAEGGLLPLCWAASSLLQGLGDSPDSGPVGSVSSTGMSVNDLHRLLVARGMPFVTSANDR
ncbi:hypothetical protein [Gordonia polyisoprenivorans]|uniref:hypothetical protein n=1 Tax=Gordonia polyisoprenivorans TaxID=84595 RepID=UPI001FCAAA6F|nr:hypothetical protein [Gordonia polyisoprenivorans]